jgi:hypothetical protein
LSYLSAIDTRPEPGVARSGLPVCRRLHPRREARDLAYAVLLRAEEIRADEKKIFGWVAEGQTIHPITAKGGYF